MFSLSEVLAWIYSIMIVGIISNTRRVDMSRLNVFNSADNENYDLEKMYAVLTISGMYVGMQFLVYVLKIPH
jgi:hypothetical protein